MADEILQGYSIPDFFRAHEDMGWKEDTIHRYNKYLHELLAYAAGNGIYHGPVFVSRRGTLLGRLAICREMKEVCQAAGISTEKGNPGKPAAALPGDPDGVHGPAGPAAAEDVRPDAGAGTGYDRLAAGAGRRPRPGIPRMR